MLHPDYLLQYEPHARPMLDLTEPTVALIRERVEDPDPDSTFGSFLLRVTANGYTHADVCDIHCRAARVRVAGLSLDTPEGLNLIRNPTDDEWSALLLARDRAYAQKVVDAVSEASRAAAAFQRLRVRDMAVYYARRPYRAIWLAITSLLDLSIRDYAEWLGDCLVREEEAARTRHERGASNAGCGE